MSSTESSERAPTQAYAVPPVARAIHLLQAISDGETAANLKQTALALGINRTTLMRLLHTLEAARFVEPIPNGKGYRIGLGLVALAARASQDLIQAAAPVLARLATSLRLSAHLAVLDGTDALFLLRQVPNVPLASNIQPGSRIPAYATTLGRIILAYWPKEQVAQLFRNVRFRSFSNDTPRSLSGLHALLAQDRIAGYAWSDGSYTAGVCSVGFAVFDQTSKPAAAINVTGPQQLFTDTPRQRESIVESVRSAAEELSIRLGYSAVKTGPFNGSAAAQPRRWPA